MKREVTFEGNSLTLLGRKIEEGMKAPFFRVVDGSLSEVNLSDHSGKVKIVASFPSIDTPVCDLEIKEFNKRATSLSEDVVILGISKDLPFAQSRFCQANDIDKVEVLSDYKNSSFGLNFGLLIKELNLLARSVIILDKADTIRYIQLVEEITSSPDYEASLDALKEVLASPGEVSASDEVRCNSCEGGVESLSKDAAEAAFSKFEGWEVVDGIKAVKEVKFKDFAEAKYFADIVSSIAEDQHHHPAITITWGKVRITLTTHAVSGLTQNDLIMAEIINGI